MLPNSHGRLRQDMNINANGTKNGHRLLPEPDADNSDRFRGHMAENTGTAQSKAAISSSVLSIDHTSGP
jgi:hypothetical protein